MEFCHIMPTDFLEKYAGKYNSHLMLAHLVESDGRYADWYEAYDGVKILDNSAFEMYKQNEIDVVNAMCSSDTLSLHLKYIL